MISIVCVYNNKEILDNFLLKSLKNQSVKYELILIDNTDGKFKSAAEALNYGGKKASCQYIMFTHQDMDLYSDDWLEKFENAIKSLDSVGIAGIAGISKFVQDIVTNVKDGIPPKYISPNRIKEPTRVQTLDECLFVIPKSIFNDLKFDEKTCDDWHLYVVDYSLSVKQKGYEVYVIPLFAYHRSRGYSFSKHYYTTLKKLLNKHFPRENVIYTTTGVWMTFYPLNLQRRFPRLNLITIRILRTISKIRGN